MKTFVKPIALLGLAGALISGAQAAEALTSANNTSYYINGAYAYETAPAYRAAPAHASVPLQQRGFESYASAPRPFGAPVRTDGVRTTEQRHLDGTE